MRWPDFIIIGGMKCATSTLHEQLAQQGDQALGTGHSALLPNAQCQVPAAAPSPRIFMSTPKEPNFFSDDDVWARGIDWYCGLFAEGIRASTHYGIEASEQGVEVSNLMPRCLDASMPSVICGESSTHYTKLPTYPNVISRMKTHLPSHTRFIYIMRHPIDRLISHYIHEWTQCVIREPIERAIDLHPELIDYGRYAMQIEPWLDAFGSNRVLPVFFDRLTAHPQEELERIAQFIGFTGPVRWITDIEQQNASSQRLKRSAIKDVLINFPGSEMIRRRWIPQSWRDRIKRQWMMTERPTLSDAARERLEAIYDEDLMRLGRLLQLDLSCATFRAATRDVVPAWRIDMREKSVA